MKELVPCSSGDHRAVKYAMKNIPEQDQHVYISIAEILAPYSYGFVNYESFLKMIQVAQEEYTYKNTVSTCIMIVYKCTQPLYDSTLSTEVRENQQQIRDATMKLNGDIFEYETKETGFLSNMYE